MEHIAMIVRKPPYGDTNAAEAVRHALGAVAGDSKVSLLLVDGGVLLARRGQDDTGTGFTNLETTLNDCCEMGVDVYADQHSLVEQSVMPEDLVEGVQIKHENEIAAIMKAAEKTLIF